MPECALEQSAALTLSRFPSPSYGPVTPERPLSRLGLVAHARYSTDPPLHLS